LMLAHPPPLHLTCLRPRTPSPMATQAVPIYFSTPFEGPEAALPHWQVLKSERKYPEHLSVQDDTDLVASFSFYLHSLHSPKIWKCQHTETHRLFPISNHHDYPIVQTLLHRQKSVGLLKILNWRDIEGTACHLNPRLRVIAELHIDHRMKTAQHRPHRR